MAIPDYQTLMLPLLTELADGTEHSLRDAAQRLADQFELSTKEREELLPSGRQPIILNRVSWARTYMSKAGLIESPGRGRMAITNRGQQLLNRRPERINLDVLMQYPEFADFYRRSTDRKPAPDMHPPTSGPVVVDPPVETAEERLESSYRSLRAQLMDDLLDRISTAPPAFFERLVVDLLVAMGYGGSHGDVIQAFGRSGDDGIDGIIKEDRLGLDFVYVQAKRWSNVIGRPVVQGFAGSLEGQRARKGVFITTSSFSKEAREYVTRIEKRIVLIDGAELANLMIDYGIGVADVATYRIKRVDLDYFAEE